jgi:phosphoglycolate phosphatase-like HAD superfamily hydrolase
MPGVFVLTSLRVDAYSGSTNRDQEEDTLPSSRSIFSFRHNIFDLDGTLIDSISHVAGAFGIAVREQYGDRGDITEHYLASLTAVQMHNRAQVRHMLELLDISADDEEIEALFQRTIPHFEAADPGYFPGAKETIHALKGRGQLVYVSSSSPDTTVEKRLSSGGLADVLDLYFGSSTFEKGHAHLVQFAAIADAPLTDFCRDACIIGDTATEVRIAKAFGMYSIGVEGTLTADALIEAGVDRIVSCVAELMADE